MPTAIGVIGLVAGVAGTAASVSASKKQASAAKRAAGAAGAAAIENIKFLEEQGAAGSEQIRTAADKAVETASGIAASASEPLLPFLEAGTGAFESAQSRILEGTGGAEEQLFANEGLAAITGRPEIFNLAGPVGGAAERETRLSAEGLRPDITQALTNLGITGVQASADIGQIERRGVERIGDIEERAGAGQAAALVGQGGPIAGELAGAEDARLLGTVGASNQRTSIANQLARLGGELL